MYVRHVSDYYVSMNYEEEIGRLSDEMKLAESQLSDIGFNVEQWMLIKRYVLAAVVHGQLLMLKTMSEEAASNPT